MTTLEKERDELKAEVAKLRAELAAAKAEVEQSDAEYQDAVTLAKSNLDRFQAAQAACAQMREALSVCQQYFGGDRYWDWDNGDPFDKSQIEAALSTDAGKGWIDASGAVEGKIAQGHLSTRQVWTAKDALPDEWAGSRVLIVRVAK